MHEFIDCACVIHGNYYDFSYVEKLYRAVTRNFLVPVKFHVYTETTREIPNYMIKHCLDDYAISGPKKSWWYKMQLFDQTKFKGQLFYFDLDVIICGSLDWMRSLPKNKFYAIRDFTEVFRSKKPQINSSIMCFDTEIFGNVYKQFSSARDHIISRFRGDQEYLSKVIPVDQQVFFDAGAIKSWRWQVCYGGINPQTRLSLNHAQHNIDSSTAVVVFHGNPKPHELPNEQFIKKYWI